jgi:anaerobic ribonucleoside-triphosphate reductase
VPDSGTGTAPRVYAVCSGCGFFYGDLMLYSKQGIDCPECGADHARAFGKIEDALAYQQRMVRGEAAWLI